MVSTEKQVLFLTRNNFCDALNLKVIFRALNCEITYVRKFYELLDIAVYHKNCILFVDTEICDYKVILKEVLENCSIFKYFTLVFIDNSEKDYYDIVNNKNVFRINLDFNELDIIRIMEQIKNYEVSDSIDLALLNNDLSEYLTSIGFSQKLTGFNFIKSAMLTTAQNNFKIGSLQNDVYKHVALLNKTYRDNVERNISSSIKDAIKRNPQLVSIVTTKDHITTREFLCFLNDKLSICYKAKKRINSGECMF